MFKLKKNAREAGYLTEDEWLKKRRVVKRGEENNYILVKGCKFYQLGVTEAVLSKKPGFKASPGSRPVRRYDSPYGYSYPVYRESDIVPVRQYNKVEPQLIDLLAAIFTVNRAAKRYRDAAISCYECDEYSLARANKRRKEYLYELKDRGIYQAYADKLVSLVGKHGDFYVYRGNGYVFHSLLRPWKIDDNLPTDDGDIYVARRDKTEKYRLKDAVYTLHQLPNIRDRFPEGRELVTDREHWRCEDGNRYCDSNNNFDDDYYDDDDFFNDEYDW